MQPHNSSTTPRKHDDSTSAALHETAAALRTLDLAVSTSNGGPGLHLLKCGGRTKRVHPETGKTSWKWDAKKPSETGWQKKRPKIDAVIRHLAEAAEGKPRNIGIVPKSAGLVAVDCDRYNEVTAVMQFVVETCGAPVGVQATPSGGAHAFYPEPKGEVRQGPFSHDRGKTSGDIRHTAKGFVCVYDAAAILSAATAAKGGKPGVDVGALLPLPRVEVSDPNQPTRASEPLPEILSLETLRSAFPEAVEHPGIDGLPRFRLAPCPICGQGSNDAFYFQDTAAGKPIWGCNQCCPGQCPNRGWFTKQLCRVVLARTGQRVLGRPAAPTARTAPPEPSVEPSGDNVTDEYTLAARYLTLHGQDRRFIYGINRWMRWTEGTGWTEDPGERVTREIQCLGQQTFGSFVDGAWKRKPMPGGRWATAAGAQRSARAAGGIGTTAAEWDATPAIIGLPGCRLLEVRDGVLRERQRTHADLVSRSLAAHPGLWENSRWAEHLLSLFDDPAILTLLQRAAGLALLGYGADDHRILMPFGRRGTGKSSTCNLIRRAFGDYGGSVDPAAILSTRGAQHPTVRTPFIGRRWITCSELPSGGVLDTGFVKAVSGGDPIRVRGMRQDEVEVVYRGLLVVHSNHQPDLPSPDDGLKRRLLVVPFQRRRPNEGQGVRGWEAGIDLAEVVGWMVSGAQDYLADGIGELPEDVQAATTKFHESADVLSEFMNGEDVTLDPAASTPLKTVYELFTKTCEDGGIKRPISIRTFSKRLREGGFGLETAKRNGVVWLDGAAVADGESQYRSTEAP